MGFVGAQAQPIVLGKQASSAPAIAPILVLPNRRPAMIVSRSKTRFPVSVQRGQRAFGTGSVTT